MKNHTYLLIALISGLLLGSYFHSIENPHFIEFITQFIQNFLSPVGQIFLRLIFMMVVPLVVSSLILGVYELSQAQGLGRIALKTLLLTLIMSAMSVLIGVFLADTFKPGANVNIAPSSANAEIMKIQSNVQAAKPAAQAFVELIPKNPLESASKALDGEMLSLMVFSLIFGWAMSIVLKSKEDEAPILCRFFDDILQTSMQVIHLAMKLAPFAVFAIVFNTAFKQGLDVFQNLFKYVLVVIAGLLLQQFLVYSAVLKIFARRSPLDFFKKCRDVYLYAFSTASSNATLPRALETAEFDLRLPPRISRFVLTIGSTANQNGTALFEGITVLFLAQVYHVPLTFAQQLQVAALSVAAGIGTAGVPGGSLPLVMILLNQIGVPAEGMGLILGVDRFLDMCRTTLNVSGDLVIAAAVAGPVEDGVNSKVS